MKFLYGYPAESELVLQAAQPLRLPRSGVLQGIALGIGLLMVGMLAAVLYAAGQLSAFVNALQVALDTQPPLVFLAALPVSLFVHELVHCLAFPQPAHSVIGILPKTGLAFAWNGQPMARHRVLVAVLAPLVLLTTVALGLYWAMPMLGTHLLPAMLFNILGAGGDVVLVYLVLRQVPSDSWFQLRGMTFWWGAPGAPAPAVA
jgi:hypothetical protein